MTASTFPFDVTGDADADRARLEATLLAAALRQLIDQGFGDDTLIAAATRLIASQEFQQIVDADLLAVQRQAVLHAADLPDGARLH